MPEERKANSDEETEFSTKTAIVPKSNSNNIYSTLKELEIGGGSIYAFIRFPQVWQAFLEWRHKLEEGLNFFQLKENQKFDEIIAKVCKNKAITDDKTLYNHLLLTYQDTGARKSMNRIKVMFEAFKQDYKANNGKPAKKG